MTNRFTVKQIRSEQYAVELAGRVLELPRHIRSRHAAQKMARLVRRFFERSGTFPTFVTVREA